MRITALFMGLMLFSGMALATDWAGPYVGASIGGGRLESTWVDVDDDWGGGTVCEGDDWTWAPNPCDGKFEKNALTLGIHGGYNLQSNNIVYGLEADVMYSKMNNGHDFGRDDGPILRNKMSVSGSLKGRIGYAYNNYLPFVSAGFAYSNLKHSWTELDDVPDSWPSFNNKLGYVLGVGLEALIGENLSVRAEYLYYDFGKKTGLNNVTYCGGAGGACRMDVDSDMNVIRIGVSRHF